MVEPNGQSEHLPFEDRVLDSAPIAGAVVVVFTLFAIKHGGLVGYEGGHAKRTDYPPVAVDIDFEGAGFLVRTGVLQIVN